MRQDLFVCPRCLTALERRAPDRVICPQDGLEFWQVDGIWRFLLPESEAHYARFITDYEAVRRSEGRGSSGNGWLSNRLAAQGDRVIAVDLSVNEQDGLGACKYYENSFIPVQAEFNHLPVMDRFADTVIFNASFHYSEDYAKTLKEALRVLSTGGLIVIMDSPVYRRGASGQKMVQEREEQFKKEYGFASDNLQSENYLTYTRLKDLAHELNVAWKIITPFYGLQWIFRPLIATLLRRREPAKFHLIVGRKIASD